MIEREIVVPVAAEELWATLTEPEAVAGWFGADVEWDVTPGGHARWQGDEGARTGLVEEVEPGHRLRFSWWPDDGGAGPSEVTYELQPVDDGESGAAVATRLVIRERPVELGSTAVTASSVNGSRFAPQAALSATNADGWSTWDSRVAGVWMQLQAPVPVRA